MPGSAVQVRPQLPIPGPGRVRPGLFFARRVHHLEAMRHGPTPPLRSGRRMEFGSISPTARAEPPLAGAEQHAGIGVRQLAAVGALDAGNRQCRIQSGRAGPISEGVFRRSSPPGHPACTGRHASSSRARRIPWAAGSLFRDGGGQLPLAEQAGISDDLKRLGLAGVARAPSAIRQQECSHDVFFALQELVRNARASAPRCGLSASPAMATIFA